MIGASALAAEPLGVAPGPAATTTAFVDLVLSQTQPGQFLVEVDVVTGATARRSGYAALGDAPIAFMGLGDTGESATPQVSIATLRYADRGWIGAPTDADKPNALYEGRAFEPLLFDRQLPVTPEEARSIERQSGTVRLVNADGALDGIASTYAVDGREVRIYYGPYMAPFASFQKVADLLSRSVRLTRNSLEVEVRARTFSLDKPLQTLVYSGAGGENGTADLAGVRLPMAFGKVRNATPILIDPTNLIYQVHDGQMQAVDAVYDRGAALTDSGTDVSGYAALVSQSVSAGQFATALDSGLFKLGSSPAGLITCDVQGDADGGYVSSVSDIALRILRDRANVSAARLNASSFSAIGSFTGDAGYFVAAGDNITVSRALDDIIGGVAGYWGAGRDGRFRAGVLNRPEARAPVFYLDTTNVVAVEADRAFIPRWRQRVAYKRNWTVQRGEDLAGSVTDARRQELAQPHIIATANDSTVQLRHLEALDPRPLESPLDDAADAQTLADRLLALHKIQRQTYEVTAPRLGYLFSLLGSIVRLTWPEYGLSGGKNCVLVGLREDGEQTTLRLWG